MIAPGDLARLQRLAGRLAGLEGELLKRWVGVPSDSTPAGRRIEAAIRRVTTGDLAGLDEWLEDLAGEIAVSRLSFEETSTRLQRLKESLLGLLQSLGLPPEEVLPLYLALDRLGQTFLVLVAQPADAPVRFDGAGAASGRLCGLVGQSLPMRLLFDRLTRASHGRDPVFLVGEPGTGKRSAARAVHALSGDPTDRFVGVNCALLPPALAEAELFGHRRGAPGRNLSDRVGAVAEADGGTLFLEEVTALPEPAQAKLLRVLQEKFVRPVGGTADLPVTTRIIAGAARDPREALDGGRFRRDLYYRLQPFAIGVPPLRDRREDIEPLFEHFVAASCSELGLPAGRRVSAAARDRLVRHDWPGNVAELEEAARSAVRASSPPAIEEDDLPVPVRRSGTEASRPEAPPAPRLLEESGALPVSIRQAEREAIERALRITFGNKTRAASILGISRKQLYVKIREYELSRPA
ncbi:MAG: sigma-54-dependent Fis family transcriptional regulator [Planctomycetes bacterium]|nr:sigma-54-dependent Fis family transcriptional regulator [Planctomycetota bacterium]